MTAGARVGFADEQRIGLRGTTRRVWGRRGVKVRQRLQLRYEWAWLHTMNAADLAIQRQRGRPLTPASLQPRSPPRQTVATTSGAITETLPAGFIEGGQAPW